MLKSLTRNDAERRLPRCLHSGRAFPFGRIDRIAEARMTRPAHRAPATTQICKRRSKNPSLEAAEWLGCAGVKIRQPRSLCLIRVRARDERRGTLREGTTCGSN